jgi:RecA-family ATPase
MIGAIMATKVNNKNCYNLGLRLSSEFIKEVKNMPHQDEIIESILPRNQVMLIAGDPWQGKSILAQNTAFSFGIGGSFHGLKLHKCRAFYITWEGSKQGIMKRFSSMQENIKPDLEPLIYRSENPMPLNTDEGYNNLHDLLKVAKTEYNIEVLIIDSFPYTFNGNIKEERSVNEWWTKLQQLINEFDLSVIIIWEVSKLPLDSNMNPEQFALTRIKGAGTIAYKVNTVIAIGELKKLERKGELVERVSKGYRLVVLKNKDGGQMDWLEVKLDPLTLSYQGQKWEYNEINCSYKAINGVE